MTTAIIGTGGIGSVIARLLASGDESLRLSSADTASARTLAAKIGPAAVAAASNSDALADVAHGGARHIGVLAAPGIPEMLLAGREREFIGQYAFPSMTAVPGAVRPIAVLRRHCRLEGLKR
jgi:hypothetical protein